MECFQLGDFVWFQDDTKEIYPGRIISKENTGYRVEICTNKKKSEDNELEVVKAKESQLQLRKIA